MDRKEAIDNLRVAVRITLMTVNFQTYRIWAHKYLEQTEPLVDGLEELKEMADERIVELTDMQPWPTCGRARDCWFIVRTICIAHRVFGEGGYDTASQHSLTATEQCKTVLDRSLVETRQSIKSLSISIYGRYVG